jgi:hypothetical protein
MHKRSKGRVCGKSLSTALRTTSLAPAPVSDFAMSLASLAGRFIPVGPATRERILDDEVFGWMQEADKKGVKVVFVADSCHSGGMERSASAFGVRFRKMDTPTIAGDQLRLKAGPTKTAMGR